MNNLNLIDWILTVALYAALWQMYGLTQPAPGAREEAVGPLPPDAARDPAATGRLDLTLQRIRRTGFYRDLDGFMSGSRLAYEAVVQAFAAGDIAPVTTLLSPAVRRTFEQVIAGRRERGETLLITFIGFAASEPVDAGLEGTSAWIEVRFVGQMVSVTTDGEGRVVAGHPRRIEDVAEIWTFARDIDSPDPNWVLVATGADQ